MLSPPIYYIVLYVRRLGPSTTYSAPARTTFVSQYYDGGEAGHRDRSFHIYYYYII